MTLYYADENIPSGHIEISISTLLGWRYFLGVTHFICPGCGAEVRVGSDGCPKCTRQTKKKKRPPRKPWEQEEIYDGLDLDLPEDDTFDYDQFIAEEFGGQPKRSGKQWLWWVTALVLLIALAYYYVP